MKTTAKCCLTAAVFFLLTLAILSVDRRCAAAYGEGGGISGKLQVFIENMLDLH